MRSLLFDAAGDDPTQWQRFDWRLLMNSHVHRVTRDSDLELVHARLRELDYMTCRADVGAWATHDDMHDELAALLDFPDYLRP